MRCVLSPAPVRLGRIESFFEDAQRRAAGFGGAEGEAIVERLRRAPALLGGIDALQRFLTWKAPEER